MQIPAVIGYTFKKIENLRISCSECSDLAATLPVCVVSS